MAESLQDQQVFVPFSKQLIEQMGGDWSELVRIKVVQDDFGVDLHVMRPTPKELREEADRVENQFSYLREEASVDG